MSEDLANEDEIGGVFGAIRRGDAEEVRRIVAAHPEELSEPLGFASSWLHYAATKGHVSVIDVLLDAGLDLEWGRRDPGDTGEPNDTPLLCAVESGRYEAAKHLLSLGNPNYDRCLIER